MIKITKADSELMKLIASGETKLTNEIIDHFMKEYGLTKRQFQNRIKQRRHYKKQMANERKGMHHFDGNPQEGSLVNHGTIGLNTLTSNQYIFLHQNYNTNFLPSHFGYQNNELNEYLENNHPSNAYSHTSGPYHYTSEHEPFHNPTISNDNMNQNELWKGNKQVQGRGNYVPWNNFNESSASDGNEYDNELWKLYKSSDKMK